MGLSNQPLDWGQTLLPSSPSKPAPNRRQQPQTEALKCPRCASTNTKFCYYNNYNKSQPRHFCKSCKRHWTKGGTLRNVPVGGARKNKRPKPSKSAAVKHTPATAAGEKNISTILYQALIGRSSSSPAMHETTSSRVSPYAGGNVAQVIPATEFQFTSSNMNGSSSYGFDQFAGNLDSVEESTITTVNAPVSGGWEMDLPSYWSWNDVDVLGSSGDLSVSWDEVIKP